MNNYIRYRLAIRSRHFRFDPHYNEFNNELADEDSPIMSISDEVNEPFEVHDNHYNVIDTLPNADHIFHRIIPLLHDWSEHIEPFGIFKSFGKKGDNYNIGEHELDINHTGLYSGQIKHNSSFPHIERHNESVIIPYINPEDSFYKFLPHIAADMFKQHIYSLYQHAKHKKDPIDIYKQRDTILSKYSHPAFDELDNIVPLLNEFGNHFAEEYDKWRNIRGKKPTFYEHYNRKLAPHEDSILHDIGRHYSNILRGL